ncbi:OmpH family outer membrane protein [Tepidicella baoligensis]|uniref:OmpH family outer membrane protein n=1 Tax=Tepidicella baoligensis TaxID=2707016 RepID=UPI0015DA4FD0|nr:OmpH family outer membrane protein [Tepidicella baoligensis]
MKSFSRDAIRRGLTVLVLGVAAATAAAQDFKIGFVNTDRIFRDSAAAKAAQTKLEQEFSRRERELENLRNQLRTASEKFEREAPTLSEAQRTARQRQLVDMDRDFQRRSREFQEDLNLRKNEELQQVLERANRVIRQIAEAEKYDLIIQEAVYINPKHDITDRVINGLNNGR